MVENLAFFSSEKLEKMEVESLGSFLFAAEAFPTAQHAVLSYMPKVLFLTVRTKGAGVLYQLGRSVFLVS